MKFLYMLMVGLAFGSLVASTTALLLHDPRMPWWGRLVLVAPAIPAALAASWIGRRI